MNDQITPLTAVRNSTAKINLSSDDEVYAVRRLAEKYALEIATAKTVARLAGLGELEARP